MGCADVGTPGGIFCAFLAEPLDDGAPLADAPADAAPFAPLFSPAGLMVGPLPMVLVPAPSVELEVVVEVEGEVEVEDVGDVVEGPADGVVPRLSSPSNRGFRQMITAMPHAVTSNSIAMNASSFCFADGPRERTTTVAVLPRRGFTGRSGMRMVICGPPRGCTGIGCGVAG